MWLANPKKKNLPLVRLLRYDIDWGNWLYRDIRDCCAQAEDLCKQIRRLAPRVLNIYVSAYAPVDDYEIYLDEPMHINGGKTELHSVLIEGENPDPGISKLRQFTEGRLAIAPETMGGDPYALQRMVFAAEAQREEEERQLFDAGRPFFTYVFLAVQIAVFIIMSLTGGTQNTQNLIRFGAKYNPLIMEGQYWRLITPVFIHIGIMHLFMNSLSLYYIGPLVERIYGKARFALIYLFAGFTGCLASFLFSPSLSAGASGAIFGLFGALLYIGTAYRDLFSGQWDRVSLRSSSLISFSASPFPALTISGILAGFSAVFSQHASSTFRNGSASVYSFRLFFLPLSSFIWACAASNKVCPPFRFRPASLACKRGPFGGRILPG